MGGKGGSSGLAVLQYIQAQQQMQAMQETLAAQKAALATQQSAAESELSTLKDSVSSLTKASEAEPPDNAAVATTGGTASADTTGTSRLLGRLSQVLTGSAGTSDQGALATTGASTNKKQLLGQ